MSSTKTKLPHRALSRQKIQEEQQDKMLFAFIMFFMFNLIASIGIAIMSRGESVTASIFGISNGKEHFMHMFDNIREYNQAKTYSYASKIYPPLATVFYRLYGLLLNNELVYADESGRYLMQKDQRAMMIYIFFASVVIILLTRLFERQIKHIKSRTVVKLITFSIVVSFPILHCICTGNIAILALLFSLCFIIYRKSENAKLRELSYLSLAVAVGLQIYPIVFILLLISEDRAKFKFSRTIIYCIVILLVPFLLFVLFENPNNVGIAIKNSLIAFLNLFKVGSKGLNFDSISITNIVYMPIVRRLINQKMLMASVALFSSEFLAIVLFFLSKSHWRKVFLLTYLFINIPGISNQSILSFILPVFVLFACDVKNREKSDWIFFILFAPILSPIPVWWYFYADKLTVWANHNGFPFEASINKVCGSLLFQLMFILVVIVEIVAIVYRCKKAAQNTYYEISYINDIDNMQNEVTV